MSTCHLMKSTSLPGDSCYRPTYFSGSGVDNSHRTTRQKTAGILISCSNHKMLHGSAGEGVARESWQPDLEKLWVGASGNSNSGPVLVWVKQILVTLKNWLGRLLASSSQKYTQLIHVNLYVFVQGTKEGGGYFAHTKPPLSLLFRNLHGLGLGVHTCPWRDSH